LQKEKMLLELAMHWDWTCPVPVPGIGAGWVPDAVALSCEAVQMVLCSLCSNTSQDVGLM